MHREDFPMLKEDIIYLDNGATTFKPKSVLNKMNEYYETYSANAHRGDYSISYKVDVEFENARKKIAEFIGADIEEVVFTSGATEGLNIIATGFFEKLLEPGDEIVITNASTHTILETSTSMPVKNCRYFAPPLMEEAMKIHSAMNVRMPVSLRTELLPSK